MAAHDECGRRNELKLFIRGCCEDTLLFAAYPVFAEPFVAAASSGYLCAFHLREHANKMPRNLFAGERAVESRVCPRRKHAVFFHREVSRTRHGRTHRAIVSLKRKEPLSRSRPRESVRSIIEKSRAKSQFPPLEATQFDEASSRLSVYDKVNREYP